MVHWFELNFLTISSELQIQFLFFRAKEEIDLTETRLCYFISKTNQTNAAPGKRQHLSGRSNKYLICPPPPHCILQVGLIWNGGGAWNICKQACIITTCGWTRPPPPPQVFLSSEPFLDNFLDNSVDNFLDNLVDNFLDNSKIELSTFGADGIEHCWQASKAKCSPIKVISVGEFHYKWSFVPFKEYSHRQRLYWI